MIIRETRPFMLPHMDWYKEEIGKCTCREFTTGFYYGKPDETTQIYDNSTYWKKLYVSGQCGGTGQAGQIWPGAEKQIFRGRDGGSHEAVRRKYRGDGASDRR